MKKRWSRWVCSRCPVFSTGYCGVYAKRVLDDAPACRYGRKRIWAEYMKSYMAAKRKS